eukprot:7162693-Prymnesium_polylepis.1
MVIPPAHDTAAIRQWRRPWLSRSCTLEDRLRHACPGCRESERAGRPRPSESASANQSVGVMSGRSTPRGNRVLPVDGAASRVDNIEADAKAAASPDAKRLSECKSARNSTASSSPARLSRMSSTTCTTTSVFEDIGGESLNAKLDKQAMWADVTRLKIRLKTKLALLC